MGTRSNFSEILWNPETLLNYDRPNRLCLKVYILLFYFLIKNNFEACIVGTSWQRLILKQGNAPLDERYRKNNLNKASEQVDI